MDDGNQPPRLTHCVDIRWHPRDPPLALMQGFVFFMELAPLGVLLLGGLWADRTDARNLILSLTLFAVALPLLLTPFADSITLQVAFLFGLSMALLQALSDPARQSIINRVTRFDIQRTVTVTTVITTLGPGPSWASGSEVSWKRSESDKSSSFRLS
ncbi:MAG: hypothetical protein Ct9H300mP8_03870 [Gammaproteobacteria bacterium]|nr:MAG: hypothetical protein Ct9H300mP8_03870 [Gammaproteobacteria bacterium]